MLRIIALSLLVWVFGCSAETTPDESPRFARVSDLPETAPAGEVLTLDFKVTGAQALEVNVRAGGGSAQAGPPTSDGMVTVTWTLGVVPVLQELSVFFVEGQSEVLKVRATPAAGLTSEPFGDVAGFLADANIAGSTEDLVFRGDEVIMGSPGGLLSVKADATVSQVALTGDAIERGWGGAADKDENLWVVDADAQKLLFVDKAGVVSTKLTTADVAFEGINDVEVAPDGVVYVSDPCQGEVTRYDPVAGEVTGALVFDRATQGGPNGMAFDHSFLYISTENTMLLCDQPDIAEFDALLAGIYRVRLDEFDAPTAVATELGSFGDGLTFDADGNLYAIIDTLEGLGLGESRVVVLPAGVGEPQTVVVADGVLYANLAFGTGAFGDTTLYLALLNIDIITGPQSRGLQRVELGIAGQ